MPARRRAVELAAARGREAVLLIGRELDLAAQNLGLSYAAIGRDVGLSSPQVARVAHGAAPSLTIVQASELLASVGLDLSIRTFPTGRPMRDGSHLSLLARFHEHLHPSLTWRTEVPVSRTGDLRAWDAVVAGLDWSFGVEAETRLRDWQAFERRISLKLRDGSVDGVVVLVWSTRQNRSVLRSLGSSALAGFPVAGSRAIELLRAGVQPPGSTLILL